MTSVANTVAMTTLAVHCDTHSSCSPIMIFSTVTVLAHQPLAEPEAASHGDSDSEPLSQLELRKCFIVNWFTP